jgi:phosphatidylserine/phosphatidylglycerophosphate/cardiolipin synthase-like enzyme
VKLLIYGNVTGGEVELSVVVDELQSSRHDIALEGLGGAEGLGIKVGKPDDRPTLSGDLEAQRLEVGAAEAPAVESGTPSEDLSELRVLVRGVGVLEHPKLLEEALTSAKKRLLLISPWIKSGVVDTAFMGKLEGRLRAGCTIHIAHGYGDDDSGSDSRALERLANLQARYKDHFVLSRLANTHAKILIADDTWVSTSFNWLSFRGDPNRTYRMEEGTLVRMPERVALEYQRYVDLIAEQQLSPVPKSPRG